MSADNGIYILKTKDSFRVIHAQAIENLFYTYLNNGTWKDDVVSTRAVEYYGDCRYTRDESVALKIAMSMAKREPILEYGIKTISTNKSWRQILKEAKELAVKELECLKDKDKRHYEYDINCLERILKM